MEVKIDNIFINDLLAANGITHQISNSHTPQKNGVAERMNRTVMESAHSSLHMRSSKLTNSSRKATAQSLNSGVDILQKRHLRSLLNHILLCHYQIPV
jgi:transposase InsO family protein